MNEATFTFRVDESLKQEFASAAKSRDRHAAQLLRDFVQKQREAAEHDQWFRSQVQQGLDAAIAGDVLSAEQVEADAAAWRESVRRKMSGAN